MADDILTPEQVQAAAEEVKLKTMLKEKYGIEDDPDTYKTKQSRMREAAEALPRYHATLEALVQASEEAERNAPKQAVDKANLEDDEVQLSRVFQADPYEGTKRVLGRRDELIDQRIKEATKEAADEAERRITARDISRSSFQQVQGSWPEAFDRNSNLHKLGRQIFNQEMSPGEKAHPRAFLIATERAAGRLGLAPKHLRSAADPREDADAQNISRQGRRPTKQSDGDDEKLTAKQKRIASLMDIDEKPYAKIAKARREGRNLDE